MIHKNGQKIIPKPKDKLALLLMKPVKRTEARTPEKDEGFRMKYEIE
jgi:hypothetical protein